MSSEVASLDGWDIATLTIYFIIILAVGIWASVMAQRGSARGFFLAGKSMTWLPIAGSIFATNMGASLFVGLCGSAASSGFAPVMFEWHATYVLILLGWIFVPIYVASGSFTMPQYLRKRFGRQRIRVYYAIVQLVLAVMTGISGELYAGSLFMQELLGWNIYIATTVILLITAVYTIGGGLAAVIYTDALQSFILVIGSIVLAVIVMDEVKGYESMVNQFIPAASNTTYLQQSLAGNMSCGFPPDDAFHIFRGMDSDYPWSGLTFGLTLLALNYFCTSQSIVQRNLSAKNVIHNKAACVLSSYLKILPFFLYVWPGMIGRILYPDEIGCAGEEECMAVCNDKNGCTNIVYPTLVLRNLPSGLRGLMLAAMIAALMSTLTSQFNGTSAVFVIDIWKVWRKQAREREVVVVGRIASLVLIGLSICWLPVLQQMQGGQLWDYLQSISAYLTPPWVVVFLLGMFWKRFTEQAAWWSLMAGLVTGAIRMGIHFGYDAPFCGSSEEDLRPDILTKVHYLHFAMILAAVTLVVAVALTFVTPPRKPEQLRRVTWWTKHSKLEPELTEDEDEGLPEEEDKDAIELSKSRRAYNWVCGFNPAAPPMTKEEMQKLRDNLTDINEDPFWSKVCDMNAVLVVAITCGIIGYYA